MLSLLLLAATGSVVGVTPSDFDLTSLGSADTAEPSDRKQALRYLLPEIEEPDDGRDGVEVRLRWRKVRVTVPIEGLQPPF